MLLSGDPALKSRDIDIEQSKSGGKRSIKNLSAVERVSIVDTPGFLRLLGEADSLVAETFTAAVSAAWYAA